MLRTCSMRMCYIVSPPRLCASARETLDSLLSAKICAHLRIDFDLDFEFDFCAEICGSAE